MLGSILLICFRSLMKSKVGLCHKNRQGKNDLLHAVKQNIFFISTDLGNHGWKTGISCCGRKISQEFTKVMSNSKVTTI